MEFPYDKLAKHIFNWPNRGDCLYEWDRVYSASPFYLQGLKEINKFFDLVMRSEVNRLLEMDKNYTA